MKVYMTVFFFAIFFSCRNQIGVKKILLNNGGYAILPFNIVNGDTILEGKGQYYSKLGILQEEIEYKKSLKNGWHISYDFNGKVEQKIMYIDDIANGEGIFFGKNGKKEMESFYFDGSPLVNKWLFENGQFKLINFMSNGYPYYAIKFDSLGQKISENGYVFSGDLINNQPLDSISIDSDFEIKIKTVAFRGYSTRIEIALFDSKSNVISIIDSLPINNYLASFNWKFKDSIVHKIGIAGELKNSTTMAVIKRDTIYRTIKVIPSTL